MRKSKRTGGDETRRDRKGKPSFAQRLGDLPYPVKMGALWTLLVICGLVVVLIVVSRGDPRPLIKGWLASPSPSPSGQTIGDVPAFANRWVAARAVVPASVSVTSEYSLSAAGNLLLIDTPCGAMTASGMIVDHRLILTPPWQVQIPGPNDHCTDPQNKTRQWLAIRLFQAPTVEIEPGTVTLRWSADEAVNWPDRAPGSGAESLEFTASPTG